MIRVKLQSGCLALLLLAGQALAQVVQVPGSKGLQLPAEWSPAAQLPAPAIVLLHGCGGAWDKHGKANARHAAMAAFLNQQGYSTLLVDSLTPRGVKQLCTVKYSERTIRQADRAADAFAALDWLAQRPDVIADQIGLLGWSNGGSSTLTTMAAARPTAGHGFAAAVAFYPGCKAFTRQTYVPSAPLLILIGESDNWTPADACQTLQQQPRPATPAIALQIYPDTWHDFDNPALVTKRLRPEVPNGVHPGNGVTIAPNPAAAKDAWARAAAWLRQAFAVSSAANEKGVN